MTLPTPTPETPTPDGELLRRFVQSRDEAAFELLVWRYSRMVFEVCRRVLRHRQDAEDATQAAFLVLARRAETVRTAVGGWLARVAYRCALRMASGRPTPLASPLGGREVGGEGVRENDLPDLDAELDRLPDRYRLPLVLCCLQGLSYHEAARQLKVKPGTLSGRLSRAKALLRDRLLARGVAVSATLAAFLSDLPRGSATSPESVRSILVAACAPPERVAAVANGVTRMFTLHAVARRSLAVGAVFAVLLGGAFAASLFADEPKTPAPADPPKAKGKSDKELMQGDWVFDSAETVGGDAGIGQAWFSLVTFEGDNLTVTKYQGLDWKSTFTLDPTASPKQFDMTVNELARKLMGLKDGTIKGIYRFDGEALEICFADSPDSPRPTEFKTGPKLKQFRFTLKRKAKDFDPTTLTEFKVKVVDGDGRPVEGAVVCQYKSVSTEVTSIFLDGKFAESISTMVVPPLPATNKDGETTYSLKSFSNSGIRPSGVLYVRHETRRLVAIEAVSPARIMTDGVTVTLRPEAKLTGKVTCPNGVDPGPTTVYLHAHNTWMLVYSSHKSLFEFTVPVGEYKLKAHGMYLAYPETDTTVGVGPEGKDLKLEAKPSALGKLRGKAAPELGEMIEWKGDAPKPADLNGKVTLLYFWGNWCAPALEEMPRLMELHDQYAEKGLAVVGVHVPSVSKPVGTVKDLDERLADTRKNFWKGRDLPFPVGLMKTNDGPAVNAFGITVFPSAVLIDKKGAVVGLFSLEGKGELDRLEKLLAER
jgi:RNA polymerase sigma factor (sigma-70 family)